MTVKLVTIFHGNIEFGIPGHQALICVFDHKTGTPLAVMDGEYITAIRTAATAAVPTKLLARQDARVLTIVGAGTLGHSHLKIIPKVRDFIDIYGSHHSILMTRRNWQQQAQRATSCRRTLSSPSRKQYAGWMWHVYVQIPAPRLSTPIGFHPVLISPL